MSSGPPTLAQWFRASEFRSPLLLLAGALVVFSGLAVVAWQSVGVRAQYGSWSSPPDRIDYCGRRYYHGTGGLSAADVAKGGEAYSVHVDYQRVGTDGWGHPYYAWVVPPSARVNSAVCTFAVYDQVGPDEYESYGLSGGP